MEKTTKIINSFNIFNTKLALLITVFIFAFSHSVNAQINKDEEIKGGTELKGIIYKQEFSAGFAFATNGYSINGRRMYAPSAFYERGFEADIVMIRHPKEVNMIDWPYRTLGSSTFPYGKLNSLYAIRFGYGENKEIAEKIDLGSIEINYFYYGGVSLGGVKPVYLKINKTGTANLDLHTEKYDPTRHNLSNIYGGVPFTKGFSEIKFYPGIYAKFGLNFDYKISTKKIGTFETGIVVDYYFKEVPIMAEIKNYSYFLSFYMSINFGKKWN